MKTTALFLLSLATSSGLRADDKPLLAVPGTVIYENKLDTAPAAPWKAAKGKWELVEGVTRGSELAEDKHGAVTRLPNKLQNFIVEYEFKFAGARSTSLSINATKDHMARISITPKSVTIRRTTTTTRDRTRLSSSPASLPTSAKAGTRSASKWWAI